MAVQVTVQGTVKPDGSLELDEKVSLPPGRVQVMVQPMTVGPSQKRGLLEIMDEVRNNQQARGHVPRTREEIDAEINAMRQDSEEEMQAVERLYEESRHAREQADKAPEKPQ